jgi:hypothetical protein
MVWNYSNKHHHPLDLEVATGRDLKGSQRWCICPHLCLTFTRWSLVITGSTSILCWECPARHLLVPEIISSGVTIISTDTSLAPTGTWPASSTCSLNASATAAEKRNSKGPKDQIYQSLVQHDQRCMGLTKKGLRAPASRSDG